MLRQQLQASEAELIGAAQYVRMSTEHQQYSIDNQSAAIHQYALDHRMEIVRTYTDAGKSGLTLANRPGLRQLNPRGFVASLRKGSYPSIAPPRVSPDPE